MSTGTYIYIIQVQVRFVPSGDRIQLFIRNKEQSLRYFKHLRVYILFYALKPSMADGFRIVKMYSRIF